MKETKPDVMREIGYVIDTMTEPKLPMQPADGRTGDRYAGIVLCEDCEYQAYETSTDIHWCRLSNGLAGELKPGGGCPRGRKKVQGN